MDGRTMRSLTSEIKRVRDSEIILSKSTLGSSCAALFFGFLIASVIWSPLIYDSDSILLFCFGAEIFIVVWQSSWFVTIIRFNQPLGYLEIKESPGWSIFFPFGPKYIKTSQLVPLPKGRFEGEIQHVPFSSSKVHWVEYRLNPNDSSIVPVAYHQTNQTTSPHDKYVIQIPLRNGDNITLWNTVDQKTYYEIVKRINKAIQDFQQLEKTQPRYTVTRRAAAEYRDIESTKPRQITPRGATEENLELEETKPRRTITRR